MIEYIVPNEDISGVGDMIGYSELIRCKDCIHWWSEKGICMKLSKDNVYQVGIGTNDYCSKAERKEE